MRGVAGWPAISARVEPRLTLHEEQNPTKGYVKETARYDCSEVRRLGDAVTEAFGPKKSLCDELKEPSSGWVHIRISNLADTAYMVLEEEHCNRGWYSTIYWKSSECRKRKAKGHRRSNPNESIAIRLV